MVVLVVALADEAVGSNTITIPIITIKKSLD
jgi:hypothetical protein